jgi:YNFM family putative membrane transporter
MFASMLLAGLCNLLAALAPNWSLLLAARFCEGLVLGGVPAVAMAWLAEEIHPRDLGKAMGLYVAGTAFGGMMGRVGMGLLVEWESWRLAMATLGALGLASALGFAVLLPPSRRFVAASALGLGHHVRVWSSHCATATCRAFLRSVPAHQRFRDPVQLCGFPPVGAAVPAGADRDQPHFPELYFGHVRLALGRATR